MEIKIDNENYTLDVEKAKELGLLKKNYSKCKSCNDFVEKYMNKPCFFSAFHRYQSIYSVDLEKSFKNHPIFMNVAASPMGCLEQLTEKDALAIFILAHLMRLRRDWVGDWEPNAEGDLYYAIFRGYEIYCCGYYPPEQRVVWEAVDENGCGFAHYYSLKGVKKLIDQSLNEK